MPTFDGFLFRDSLQDTGTVPSPGYPYYSPDIIGHAQVADPATFFTGNYGSDPNQPIEKGSAVNYVYVRAKNLSPTTKSGYYATVYRSNPSLFMNTSVWKGDPLKTQAGDAFVSLPSTATQQIAVGAAPFLLNATTSNRFCVIGMVTPTSTPTIPDPFASYDAYITWQRTNQNICGRNLHLSYDYPNRNYEQLDEFSNPETMSVPTLFQVTIHGALPANSTFGLTCAPLGLSTTWNVNNGNVQTASAMTPPSFNGNVTTWATLSSGSWPSGVWIETIVYVGVSGSAESAVYAETEWKHLGGVAPQVLDESRPQLVRVGNCATRFVSTR